MIIARFGDTWAGAYVLPNSMMADDFSADRPAITSRVGGQDGEFDYIGTDANPIAPVRVRKSAIVSATTWAGVETALAAMRAALVGNESKLWGEVRDGSRRWAWAKCIGFKASDRFGQILHCPIDIEFLLTEGLWYSEAANTTTKTTAAAHVMANAGNVPAAVKVTVVPAVAAMTAFAAAATGQGWSWAGTLNTAKSLIVDSAAYSATNDGAEAFSALTITRPSALWLHLLPGNNTITISKAQCGGGTFAATFEWYDTWIM